MRSIIRLLDGILLGGAILASAAAFLLSVMLIIEVITTSFFNWSQPWAVEYSGYLLAVIMFAGSGWALGQNAHIRVAVLTTRLPARYQRALGLVTGAMAFALSSYMAKVTTENAWRSFVIGSTSVYPSHTPIFLPQGFLALSMILLALGFLNHLLKLVANGAAATAAQAEPVMEAI